MIKYILSLGLVFGLATMSSANHAEVAIKHADKVVVKSGLSHKDMMMKMKCMLVLKKHDNKEDAIKHILAKIDAKCGEMKDPKKCDHIKRKIAKFVAGCFIAGDFFKEFMGKN